VELLGAGFNFVTDSTSALRVKKLDFFGTLYEGMEVPRQASVLSRSTAAESSSTNSVESLSDYAMQKAERYDGGLGFSGFLKGVRVSAAASGGTTEATAIGDSLRTGHTITLVTKEISVLTASLIPDVFLRENDPDFNMLIDSLPPDGSAADFQTVINLYGTHFLTGVTLGGLAQSSIEDSVCVKSSSTLTSTSVRAQAEFSASRGLQAGSVEGGTSAFNEKTAALSISYKASTIFKDDRPPIPSQGGWEAWEAAVAERPWPIKYKITPIYEAVKDDSKRALLQEALSLYVQSWVISDSEDISESSDMSSCKNYEVESDVNNGAITTAICSVADLFIFTVAMLFAMCTF